MDELIKPSYWAVIPATVRYDEKIPPNAKLIYAEISALSDACGYCFAQNETLAKNFGMNPKSVQRLIKALADRGYISVDVVRNPDTKEVVERRIYAGINPAGNAATPSPQNCGEGSPQNCGEGSPQNCGVEQYNNIINNNPLYPPKGNSVRRSKHPPREAPDWNPERFNGLWKFYPAKGRRNKQDAMDVWDRLQPSDELIDEIAAALVKQKASEDWTRGIGIPYVSTYLNKARWEDAKELDPDVQAEDSEDSSGWAPDPEVM